MIGWRIIGRISTGKKSLVRSAKCCAGANDARGAIISAKARALSDCGAIIKNDQRLDYKRWCMLSVGSMWGIARSAKIVL